MSVGRPKGREKTETTMITFTPEEKERIRKYAERYGLGFISFVRFATLRFIDENPINS